MTKNSDICRVLYASLPDNYFKCKYCGTVRRQQPSSGYGNLISHLRDKHPEYETDYVAHTGSLAANLYSFDFVSDKIANIYHWMEWVVDRNMPLSEVDHPLTRSMSRLKPISSKVLRKYLSVATVAVEKVIVANIPPEFGIMFDGWQCLSEHYVALIVMYWRNDETYYDLLAIASLDEADQSTESHCSFLRNILPIFGQSEDSLKFLVGDNCATNQRMATLLGVPLVGCASHRFNLASNQFLTEHEELATAVTTPMTALRTLKNRAELRRHTQLAPFRANVTRWSSTFTMLGRYVRIRDAIKRVGAVYYLIPKPAMHRRIVALYETLKTFNSVCKKLQEEALSMTSVRVLFDKMVEMYPVTAVYLSSDANIVHSPAFESAVVKLEALEPLKATTATGDATPTDSRVGPRTRARHGGEDFATALLLSDSVPVTAAPQYCPLVKALPPTSNRCERLFSQCKLVMTPQRSSLLPVNFEMIEFLRVNRKYWNASTLMDANVDGEEA